MNQRYRFRQSLVRGQPALPSLLLVLLFTLFAPSLTGPSLATSLTADHATTPSEQNASVVEIVLGNSTQGRLIDGVRIGDGPRKLVVVAGTHGWPERNTHELARQLAAYFRANPSEVPDNIRLYIIPLLNPDGLAVGTRNNANNVDLNRNMDTSFDPCPENDWQQQAAGAYGKVWNIGGPHPESEIESRLIRDFLLDADGVIFLHSAAGLVFPACQHPPSDTMAQIYAANADYTYTPEWAAYRITGGLHDWAGGLGIAAITPELLSGALPETEQNLAGLLAVLQAFDEIVPEVELRSVDGLEVHPIIWRAWTAWGGRERFGAPLAAPIQNDDGWTQLFERAIFEYQPEQSDTTAVVQLGVVVQHVSGKQISAPVVQPVLNGLFAQYWQTNGGQMLFGSPTGPEEELPGSQGRTVIRQQFERIILERPADAVEVSQVSLAPVGRLRWAQIDNQSPESQIVAR